MRRLLAAPVRRRLAAEGVRALSAAACPCCVCGVRPQSAPVLLASSRAVATRSKRVLPPSIIVVRTARAPRAVS